MEKIIYNIEHKKGDEVLLLRQISNYIKSAPLRRLKRSGSLGLSDNSIRNLRRFYDLTSEFEFYLAKSNEFKEWLLTIKGYSLNNAGLQLKFYYYCF